MAAPRRKLGRRCTSRRLLDERAHERNQVEGISLCLEVDLLAQCERRLVATENLIEKGVNDSI
jgi:hypothetical protein